MHTKRNKNKKSSEGRTLNNRNRLKSDALIHLQSKILHPLEQKMQEWIETLATSSTADLNTVHRMQIGRAHV
jgi:hypothetical protein